MLRYVLDTDVIVVAMRSPSGASAALLGEALDKRFKMLASVPLFFEYEAKCISRAHWLAAGLNREQALVFVNGMKQADMDAFRTLLFRSGGEPPRADDELT